MMGEAAHKTWIIRWKLIEKRPMNHDVIHLDFNPNLASSDFPGGGNEKEMHGNEHAKEDLSTFIKRKYFSYRILLLLLFVIMVIICRDQDIYFYEIAVS